MKSIEIWVGSQKFSEVSLCMCMIQKEAIRMNDVEVRLKTLSLEIITISLKKNGAVKSL